MVWLGPGTGPRAQRTAEQAAAYARSMVGRGVYRWGTGNHLTKDDDERDCFGFAFNECYLVPRHRPGWNRGWHDADGRTPSVVDDLNVNSLIEAADHGDLELVYRTRVPAIGDLIGYPTIKTAEGLALGHIKIIVGLDRCLEWDPLLPDWTLLDTVEMCGPNGHRPGIVLGNGYDMNARDSKVRDPRDRTALLRVRGPSTAPVR